MRHPAAPIFCAAARHRAPLPANQSTAVAWIAAIPRIMPVPKSPQIQRTTHTYSKTPESSMDHRGFKPLFRDSRFDALDLASLDALHADANANVLAVDGGANRLQVRAEGALIANM